MIEICVPSLSVTTAHGHSTVLVPYGTRVRIQKQHPETRKAFSKIIILDCFLVCGIAVSHSVLIGKKYSSTVEGKMYELFMYYRMYELSLKLFKLLNSWDGTADSGVDKSQSSKGRGEKSRSTRR